MIGLTNQEYSCTSLPCKWTIPNKKTEVEPRMVCDMDWKVSKHGQLGENMIFSWAHILEERGPA
jgi:hypothetical protein